MKTIRNSFQWPGLCVMWPGLCAMLLAAVVISNGWAADEISPPAKPAPSPAAEDVTLATMVATVNGTTITYGELEQAVHERIPNVTGHGTISPARMRQRALGLLEQLITDELILQEAKRLGVKPDRKKVEAEIKRQRGLFPSDAEFQAALKERSITDASFRTRIERTMLVQRVIDREVNEQVTVTDAQMAAYYREHPDKFVIPTQYRLRLLLLPVDAAASPETWAAEERRGIELRARAQRGEDFGALVRQFSGDADTKEKGGDTGLFHHGQLGLPEVENAIESLKPGDVTAPVRSIYGFYLARIEEQRPGRQQPYDDLNKELLRRELTESKRRERYQEWLAALQSRATITRSPALAP